MENKSTSLSPVLVLYYNRPHFLEQICRRLIESGVSQVFFAGDGPKNEEDKVKVEKCREVINHFYPDLPPSSHLQRSSNLGCRTAVSGSLEWFFHKNECGIVVEDDCLPNQEFFFAMTKLLEKFKVEPEIFLLNGSNFLPKELVLKGTYRSIYPQIWGWATWADRWQNYRLDFQDSEEIINRAIDSYNLKLSGLERFLFKVKWRDVLSRAGQGLIDTWDYSLLATMWRSRTRALQIDGSLVLNIGFFEESTHFSSKPNWAMDSYRECSDLSENQAKYSIEGDKWLSRNLYGCTSYGVLKMFLRRVLSWSGLIER